MLELAQASAIGFGTRRWTGADDEELALATALDGGCSLVDIAGPLPELVESTVGRVLSRRLADVTVLATTTDVDLHAIVGRVRTAAARLRRDRLDVLVVDPAQVLRDEPDRHLADAAVRDAFAVCEALADRGELVGYGVRLDVSGAAGAPACLLERWVELAHQVRAQSRFAVVQLPCSATGHGPTNDAVLAVHRAGLRAVGTDTMPTWPGGEDGDGSVALATCRQHLVHGVDHVVVDPTGAEQFEQCLSSLA